MYCFLPGSQDQPEAGFSMLCIISSAQDPFVDSWGGIGGFCFFFPSGMEMLETNQGTISVLITLLVVISVASKSDRHLFKNEKYRKEESKQSIIDIRCLFCGRKGKYLSIFMQLKVCLQM